MKMVSTCYCEICVCKYFRNTGCKIDTNYAAEELGENLFIMKSPNCTVYC